MPCLSCIMPSHAMKSRTMPCHAIPCHAMPRQHLGRHAMPCTGRLLTRTAHLMPCPCRALPCLPFHAMPNSGSVIAAVPMPRPFCSAVLGRQHQWPGKQRHVGLACTCAACQLRCTCASHAYYLQPRLKCALHGLAGAVCTPPCTHAPDGLPATPHVEIRRAPFLRAAVRHWA